MSTTLSDVFPSESFLTKLSSLEPSTKEHTSLIDPENPQESISFVHRELSSEEAINIISSIPETFRVTKQKCPICRGYSGVPQPNRYSKDLNMRCGDFPSFAYNFLTLITADAKLFASTCLDAQRASSMFCGCDYIEPPASKCPICSGGNVLYDPDKALFPYSSSSPLTCGTIESKAAIHPEKCAYYRAIGSHVCCSKPERDQGASIAFETTQIIDDESNSISLTKFPASKHKKRRLVPIIPNLDASDGSILASNILQSENNDENLSKVKRDIPHLSLSSNIIWSKPLNEISPKNFSTTSPASISIVPSKENDQAESHDPSSTNILIQTNVLSNISVLLNAYMPTSSPIKMPSKVSDETRSEASNPATTEALHNGLQSSPTSSPSMVYFATKAAADTPHPFNTKE